jgi:hypothetical protein
MASVAEISPLNTEFDTPSKGVSVGLKKAIEEIAQVIFQRTKISLEGSARAVMPSIPVMLSEIADDIREGSVDKFKISLEKLEKITGKLGVDLSKYNKELAKFLKDREENTIKSEQKIVEIREKGAKAEIDQITGKINVLSREEIKQRTDTLKQTLVSQKKLTKLKNKEEKQLQKSSFLTEEEIETKKKFVSESYDNLEIMEQRKRQLMDTLGIENEEDLPGTGFMGMSRSGSGGGGSSSGEGIRDYTPDFIMNFFDDIKGQLMGFIEPFIILKDVVFQLLKPLKIFGKLFKPLLAGMSKLIKSIGRQILVGMMLVATNLLRILTDKKVLIGLAAIAALVGLKKGIDAIKKNTKPPTPEDGSAGSSGGEASMDPIDSHYGVEKMTDQEEFEHNEKNRAARIKNSGDPRIRHSGNYDFVKGEYKSAEDRAVDVQTLLRTDEKEAMNNVAVNNNTTVGKTDNTANTTTVIGATVNESAYSKSED